MGLSRIFLFFLIVAWLLKPMLGWSQMFPSEIYEHLNLISEDSYRSHFQYIHASEGDSRKVVEGPEQLRGHDACRDYVYQCFKSYLGENQVYIQPFSIQKFEGLSNVIGVKKGLDSLAGIWIIGAHYDTNNNREPNGNPDGPSPGANDNGTGIVAVLELARVLSNIETSATIVFAAWDFEERFFNGYPAGSNFWFRNLVQKKVGTDHKMLGQGGLLNLSDIKVYLNFDMFGNPQMTNNGQKVLWLCSANNDHNEWVEGYRTIFSNFVDGISVENAGKMVFSDHLTFAQRGIPSVEHLESEYFNDQFYHTYGDHYKNEQNIDFAFAAKVPQGALAYVLSQVGVQMLASSQINFLKQPLVLGESPAAYYWQDSSDSLSYVYSLDGRKIKAETSLGVSRFSPNRSALYRLVIPGAVSYSLFLEQKLQALLWQKE